MANNIRYIHTLGPEGTNCERAAREWFSHNDIAGGEVTLYSTLEEAAQAMPADLAHALLGCVVYPKLNHLVFKNLNKFSLVDCFIMDTDHMVIAAKDPNGVHSKLYSHPAPVDLSSTNLPIEYANSNSHAAILCACDCNSMCITTRNAALKHGLTEIQSFGQIKMGFSIHAPSQK